MPAPRATSDTDPGMRRPFAVAAVLALLIGLSACSSDDVSHSIGAALRGWCQNTPEHCSLADNR